MPVNSTAPATPVRVAVSLPRAEVEPLTAELDRFHLTVPRTFRQKLSAARDALSHKLPGATDGEVLEAALDLVSRSRRSAGTS